MKPVKAKVAWRSRGESAVTGANPFHIPEEAIPPGMSWQWKRLTYAGKEDITHQMMLARDGAWDPVPHEAWPARLGKMGVEGGPIVIDGMMLMQRPLQYTREAEMESLQAAKSQVSNKFAELGLSDTALPRIKPKSRRNIRPKQYRLTMIRRYYLLKEE